MGRTPREPISREAKKHLESKLQRMSGRERKKAEKRCEMYDRGYRSEKTPEIERG